MANKLTLLKCPQCGSNQVEPVGDDRFQCKSCKSFFMYDSNRIYNITNNTYHNPNGFTQPGTQKKLSLVIGIFSVLFIVVMMINVFSSSHSGSSSFISPAEKEKQEIESATVVLGANGPQVWKIASLTTGMDKHRYVFIKEDAVTRKLLQMDTLSGVLDWTAFREHPYQGAELFSYGRYCFLIYADKSKIKAYYTATGKLAWDETTFPQHFPEFNTKVVQMGEDDERYRRFYIHGTNGITYYYFVDNDTVMTKESFDNVSYRFVFNHALVDTTFFSFFETSHADGLYSNLYRIRRIASLKDPRNGYLFEYDYARNLQREEDRKQNRVSDFTQITPSVRYFKADRVYQDGKRAVIAYHSDANEKGPLLMTLVNADGTVAFTTGGNETEAFRNLLHTYRTPIYYQNRLFFFKQGDAMELAVLNLETGKLDLHYKQDNN